ncbi:MAG: DUF5655 domain-containing protein [Candidatus Levyibacteriota bacterium]
MDDAVAHKFFSDNSVQLHLFDAIKKYISSLGVVKIKVTKSQISFSNKRQFAWVWLPMPWDTGRPKNSIVLSFSLGERVMHPQIVEVVEPYPGRFMHHVIMEKEAELSGAVKKWLQTAFTFGEERN